MLSLLRNAKQCGNSSVGRAQPCQGWGREFESRFPLHDDCHYVIHLFVQIVFMCCIWRGGRVVMQRPAKPWTPVRFRPPPPCSIVFICTIFGACRDGGTGRRKGLKIPRELYPVPVRLRLAAPTLCKNLLSEGVCFVVNQQKRSR